MGAGIIRDGVDRSSLLHADGELFQNMNTRVPSEPIFILSHEFEKLTSIK